MAKINLVFSPFPETLKAMGRIRQLSSIGSHEAAHSIFESFYRESRAYRTFIDERGGPDSDWEDLPVLTKKNFYSVFSWKEIIPERNWSDIFQIVRSTGATFWPKLKSISKETSPLLDKMLVETFHLREKRTLVIIGLSLGSWAAGKEFLAAFRAMATHGGLPLVIFAPGDQHEEILEAIGEFGPSFEQVLLVVSPSAIFYLERLAKKTSRTFPIEKIRMLVTGEPFPEELRLEIQRRPKRSLPGFPLMSIYAASDTGILGYESAPLVRFRQHLANSSGVAERLGLASPSSANLYHANLLDGCLEEHEGDLLVTRWQGLPLVRYNLRDEVKLFSWDSVCSFMSVEDPEGPWSDPATRAYPDLIEMRGRAEGCVLSGSNMSEAVLRRALSESSFSAVTSGIFVAWVSFEGGRQALKVQLELKEGIPAPSNEKLEAYYQDFVVRLGELQPEFRHDYGKYFKAAESDGFRAVEIFFSHFPHLSDHPRFLKGPKRKSFVESGPV